ncbi:DNA repair protein RAD2 [Candida viswanathii]|uniref:DNA repair protein RAD2 n=1 Tax=Candida viswanathii TaxID=5486 RepID=A0A367Y2N7_9ASCO|nr:DNA repair protein RAD2 [Candida viswanathii]
MGVHSLWQIVGPSARPVRLEALSRKKLAIDASIWIYQFLKAVRDKDGNSLPLSHIVGFFRRICKLLYYGILPIFVFDGGVPALKRHTISERRQRREKHSMSTRETAQKLLGIQLQREAEKAVNGKAKKKLMIQIGDADECDDADEEIVFLEDLPVSAPIRGRPPQESTSRPKSIKFRKDDEYHLPNLTEFRVTRDDGRIMRDDELAEYYEDFDHVDGININEIDPKSKEFEELPISTQYMILSHLRLKSRLRMGYRKDQLEQLFPDSMDFSKFQIQQVQRRNFYTQKLMNVTGMDADSTVSKRVAGDSSRRYALVKNDDGWTLSLDATDEANPMERDIDSDDEEQEDIMREVESYKKKQPKFDSEDSESDFEEVPLGDKPETEEEMNYQKALVESIYDQYNTARKAPEPKLAVDGYNEEELKQAVEKSKLDYYYLQQQEKQLQGDDDDDFDFSTSALFASNVNVGSLKEKTEPKILIPKPAKTSQTRILNGPTNLGGSFLFNADTHKTGRIEIKKSEALFEPEESDKEKEESEDEEVVEPEAKPKPVGQQTLPDWFKDDVRRTLNPHNEKFVTTNAYDKQREQYREDEEAGLVSWTEAREYLNQQEDEERAEARHTPEIVFPENQVAAQEEDSGSEPEEPQRKAAVIDYQFEEEEEEDLVKQLQQEMIDHETLRHKIKTTHISPMSSIETRVTDEQLLKEKLQKAKRDSDEVTETMVNDVQELLRRFGIPYITAPMEAEAQCAELYRIGLVDGIVTDDSDCFLFGGDKIYKNMFDQKQYVECYMQDDLSAKMGLTRKKLIELALLLGSDYTEGIKGIGPVLAMEILAEFGSLEKFKEWFDLHTRALSDRSNTSTLQKNLLSRIKKGNLYLSDSFPDTVVVNAYTNPEVDSDKTKFKWGVPDLDQIRSFLMYNLSWSQAQVDEVMVPLIRDMNKRRSEGTQSTIGEFFPQEYIQTRKELKLGKRMKTAANKLKKK